MMLTHRYDFKSLAEIYESEVINNRQLIKGVIHFSREAHENLKPTKLSRPQYPTRAIQFGEGNFLRAFIDWQLDLLNEKTDLATGVTIVRPINTVFPPSLNTQDGLYTTVIRGLNERGEAVSEARIIRSVNNEINPRQDFAGYLALARDPEIAFVFSNTTEAGISYHAGDRPDDMPPVSFPAKLTQLLLSGSVISTAQRIRAGQ